MTKVEEKNKSSKSSFLILVGKLTVDLRKTQQKDKLRYSNVLLEHSLLKGINKQLLTH